MVLGEKVASFDLEWGRNSAPREGHQIPWHHKEETQNTNSHTTASSRSLKGYQQMTNIAINNELRDVQITTAQVAS